MLAARPAAAAASSRPLQAREGLWCSTSSSSAATSTSIGKRTLPLLDLPPLPPTADVIGLGRFVQRQFHDATQAVADAGQLVEAARAAAALRLRIACVLAGAQSAIAVRHRTRPRHRTTRSPRMPPARSAGAAEVLLAMLCFEARGA
jgi:hypothetical protein